MAATKKAPAGAPNEDTAKVQNFPDNPKTSADNLPAKLFAMRGGLEEGGEVNGESSKPMDRKLLIAVAKTRKSKEWKNKKVSWDKLAAKCSEVKITHETLEEYMTMSKDDQGRIKDVGGFVGGRLKDGRRKRDSIMLRSLLTLDLDNEPHGAWEAFCSKYRCTALIYSTHKHSPEKPRYRLVIPLARDVSPEEYEPIGRRVADDIGIEMADPTTYEPSRMMYWPSASKDAVFYFNQQEGEWLSPDEVLSTYADWRDVSEWPHSEMETATRSAERKQMGDPRRKPGVIGDFCCAYSIEDAIEAFLADVYEPTTVPGRYTYKEGTTSGGLVCYEGLYAYSHHSTDPAGGRECNAFDLVRIHLFGDKDKDVTRKANIENLPSHVAMCKWCGTNQAVAQAIFEVRRQRASEDFEGIADDKEGGTEVEEVDDLLEELERDERGNVRNTPNNRKLIAAHDPEISKIRYDRFVGVETVEPRSLFHGTLTPEHIDDDSMSCMSDYIEGVYHIKIDKTQIDKKILYMVRRMRSFHPVKDFIERAEWDGKPRVDTLLIDYLGADDTPLNRAITRKWMAAAVARIYEPGTQFDYILTLAGPEGIGKTQFFKRLGGKWLNHSVSFKKTNEKDTLDQLVGSWIIEIEELQGMGKATVEEVKAFITKQVDKFRGAYKEKKGFNPRTCVFAATTNEVNFLHSTTGDRRWWVVDVPGSSESPAEWFPRFEAEIAQIWAEAKRIYEGGEKLYLPTELLAEARRMQADHNALLKSELPSILGGFLDIGLPSRWEEMDMVERRNWFYDKTRSEGSYKRNLVCIAEIANEFTGWLPRNRKGELDCTKLAKLLDLVPGWKRVLNSRGEPKTIRVGIYGIAKAWERVNKIDNSGCYDFDPIDDDEL